MKTIRESLLALVFMILWITVLAIAGVFAATLVVSDALLDPVIQHPDRSIKAGARVTI